MFKKIITTFVLLTFLGTSAFVWAEEVYVTKRGKRYHKEDCRLIKKSTVSAIEDDDAEDKGLSPCKRCFRIPKKDKAED